tara:strand:- start:932 stop:1048 length:117 start_codon:yes stop_codon:yes gene_type:complete
MIRGWLLKRELRKLNRAMDRVLKIYPKEDKDSEYGGDD